MATWVTHLRLAQILADKKELDGLDLPLFYLGNIAPDSGEPRDNGYIPPKILSHFGHSRDREYDRFLREYMPSKESPVYPFMLGYFIHLLADGIWVTSELEYQKKKFAGIFPDEEIFYSELKKDLYTADREFINSHGDFDPLKQILRLDSFENSYFPFFSSEAFDRQVKRIIKSIEGMTNGKYDYKYMLPESVEKYIDLAAETIMERLRFYGLVGSI